MRRVLSLLFLLCFTWTQAFAADCPLEGSAPDAHAAAAHGAHAEHGHHAPASAPDAPAQHHTGGACPMVSACGVAALPTAAVSGPAVHVPAATPVFAPPKRYASPALAAEPPPPRAP